MLLLKGLYAIPSRPISKFITDLTVFVELSITETVFELKLDIYTLLLSGLYTTLNGTLSTDIVSTKESAQTFLCIKYEQDKASVINSTITREQEKACFFIIKSYFHIFKLRNKLDHTMFFDLKFNI